MTNPNPAAPPPFLWVTCHVGAEAFLRGAFAHGGTWRPAFARPGLLTFKPASGAPVDPALPRPHPLARCWGASLGRATTAEEVPKLTAHLPWGAVLQVQAGEAGPPGQVPPKVLAAWTERVREAEERIALALGDRVSTGAARLGDPVIDVIVRPDEPWLVGHHVHDLSRGPLAGGRWPLSPPDDAPSRAWAKIEELVAWSGEVPVPGQQVLEVGSAPGGATVALLDRGLKVVAVDPKPYALPARLSKAPFRHLQHVVEGLPRDAFPDDVHWIVVDVSMAAPLAVRQIERLVPRYRRTLRGCFVTLKLNEWSLAERIPGFLRQLSDLGFGRVEAANLPSFRQEVGVVAVGLR